MSNGRWWGLPAGRGGWWPRDSRFPVGPRETRPSTRGGTTMPGPPTPLTVKPPSAPIDRRGGRTARSVGALRTPAGTGAADPFFKWGHLLRFDRDEIDAWLEQSHVRALRRSTTFGVAGPADPASRGLRHSTVSAHPPPNPSGESAVLTVTSGQTLKRLTRGFSLVSRRLCCALGRIRTCDTRFRKPMLYPLSYEGGVASRRCRWRGYGPLPSVDRWVVRSDVLSGRRRIGGRRAEGRHVRRRGGWSGRRSSLNRSMITSERPRSD